MLNMKQRHISVYYFRIAIVLEAYHHIRITLHYSRTKKSGGGGLGEHLC